MAVRASPPLLFLHSYIGWLRNSIVKFRETQNFDKIILNFAKFRKIRGKFCVKFCEIAKIKFFAATLLIHNLLSAAQTPVC